MQTDRITIDLSRPLAQVAVVNGQAAGAAVPPVDPVAAQVSAGTSPQQEAELAALRSARIALENGVARLQELQQQFLAEAEEKVVDLSVGIARKILMQEIQAGRHDVDQMVREALSRIPTGLEVTVHLHPTDLDQCGLAGQEGEETSEKVRFVADPNAQRGECLLETASGTVVSSIDDHLAEVTDALKSPEQVRNAG